MASTRPFPLTPLSITLIFLVLTKWMLGLDAGLSLGRTGGIGAGADCGGAMFICGAKTGALLNVGALLIEGLAFCVIGAPTFVPVEFWRRRSITLMARFLI